MTQRTSWQDLRPEQRGLIIAGAVVDLSLRVVAMIDVIRRPRKRLRGPKPLWIALLATINSGGVLPAAYLTWGRRRDDRGDD